MRRPAGALASVLASVFAAVAAVAAGGGCLVDDKGEEEEEALLDDGKDDSFRNPTYHGGLAWDEAAIALLTLTERHHAWTFELSGDARVELTTGYAVRGQRKVDTVLYLYREGPTGWGPYLARNDDHGGTVYSRLERSLGAGRYRALVKGFTATTVGRFRLTARCQGAGCAPAPSACLFGDTYGDLAGNPLLTPINHNSITAARLDWLTAADQERLVVAVQQSAHDDVRTPAEALARVDGGVVEVTWLAEPAARRRFIAFEYGVGDSSYGAIFDHVTGAIAARIQDGDLAACTVEPETCLLPEDYLQLRTDPAFVLLADTRVTTAAGLPAIVHDQLLDALRRAYGADLAGVADGLALADDGTIDHRTYRFTGAGGGVELDVVAWGAGDTSVGAIYRRGTLDLAARISDLFLEGCALFAP